MQFIGDNEKLTLIGKLEPVKRFMLSVISRIVASIEPH